MDQTSGSPEGTGQDCMEDAPVPQGSIGGGLQQRGQQCVDEHCHVTVQHLLRVVFSVQFKLLVSTCHAACHCNSYCLLLCPSLDSVPKSALVNPKRLSTSLFLLTSFEHFFGQCCWMFPFCTVAFAVWCVIVDPCFVPSDDVFQKGVSYLMVVIQRALASGQMASFCDLL
jgi:hypothetical protein